LHPHRTDDAATRFIVNGEGTVTKGDMPFLNRHEELWQIFRVNARNIHQILKEKELIDDFRQLDLLFCVQVSDFCTIFRRLYVCDVDVLIVCSVLFSSRHSTLALARRRWARCSRTS
jgi:hypothetical protein